jgi:hypothetical protein
VYGGEYSSCSVVGMRWLHYLQWEGRREGGTCSDSQLRDDVEGRLKEALVL